jgi:hypothetical protein
MYLYSHFAISIEPQTNCCGVVFSPSNASAQPTTPSPPTSPKKTKRVSIRSKLSSQTSSLTSRASMPGATAQSAAVSKNTSKQSPSSTISAHKPSSHTPKYANDSPPVLWSQRRIT